MQDDVELYTGSYSILHFLNARLQIETTDMDKNNFSKQLDLLHSRKEAITRYSSKKPGKYVMNTLLNAIKDAIQTLELLKIPTDLEAERSKTLSIIKNAQEQINREYLASPTNINMIETISQETNKQVDQIRDVLRQFDSQGLRWIN